MSWKRLGFEIRLQGHDEHAACEGTPSSKPAFSSARRHRHHIFSLPLPDQSPFRSAGASADARGPPRVDCNIALRPVVTETGGMEAARMALAPMALAPRTRALAPKRQPFGGDHPGSPQYLSRQDAAIAIVATQEQSTVPCFICGRCSSPTGGTRFRRQRGHQRRQGVYSR